MAHNFATRNTFWKAIGRTITAMGMASLETAVEGAGLLAGEHLEGHAPPVCNLLQALGIDLFSRHWLRSFTHKRP